ncbi:hypothetical protein TspCOW1_07300 [Thiohalobacter sp. COW1]|uniref:Exonuclease VII small subunit n=1 Tax=Thiohalobacter thiocyanaticus TaxID=585455 RepID=A0A1Z4VS52_9GAMM|nr:MULTISPECIES: hypothetical protein [Thiohalobacter]BAZ94305.1 exonuclease VII small subunit [Thiohalobacter thiocyanaticus]BCO30627.1 hypothetical protein TspCOW1_07300 [Thiohalobacter sp. COW1]
MELSSVDALRLNVMLANELEAVRIDESSMTVYGLSPQGETAVRLNPNCRDESYVKQVKELLSTQVLGSPGGYPVYLKRWTRMGQTRDNNLDKLLMLGEPEAVVAVVHARGLTEDLARRAWWAMPSADNARKMLARDCVAASDLGRELAAFLIEFLPFEENPQDMIESVRLILQPGLIDDEARSRIWERARHKNTYYVGFLQTVPDALPAEQPPHPALEALRPALALLLEQGNPAARLLDRIYSPAGQAYLRTVETVLRKPNNQDVVVELFEALKDYFSPVAAPGERLCEIDAVLMQAETRRRDPAASGDAPLAELLEAVPEHADAVQALCVFAGVGERLVAPIFARTDAIGSVMRRKIEPVTTPLFDHLQVLRGKR